MFAHMLKKAFSLYFASLDIISAILSKLHTFVLLLTVKYICLMLSYQCHYPQVTFKLCVMGSCAPWDTGTIARRYSCSTCSFCCTFFIRMNFYWQAFHLPCDCGSSTALCWSPGKRLALLLWWIFSTVCALMICGDIFFNTAGF